MTREALKVKSKLFGWANTLINVYQYKIIYLIEIIYFINYFFLMKLLIDYFIINTLKNNLYKKILKKKYSK